jgi:hypothetical protein
VAPLLHLTLRLVADNIEDVETLWGLPEGVKARVAGEVCARRALTPAAARLFVEHSPAEVALPDCTLLDPGDLAPALLEAATPRLQRLHLGMCGRGATDRVAAAVAAGGVLSSLTSLHLGGAYRLGDAGLLALLRAAPSLRELQLPLCSRLEGPAVEALPVAGPRLRALDLGGCRGLSAATLRAALTALPLLETREPGRLQPDACALRPGDLLCKTTGAGGSSACVLLAIAAIPLLNITSANVHRPCVLHAAVRLDGLPEVDDSLLGSVARAAPLLHTLSLASCPGLTDAGVEAAARALPGLRSIVLDECKVTGAAALALAEHCPSLRAVSLARCARVDDAAVEALAALGTLRLVSLNGATLVTGAGVEALARGCGATLEDVDLSWCRGVGSASLGRLADGCPSLARLALWGCTQAGEIFLHGHSNARLRVEGRGEALGGVAL